MISRIVSLAVCGLLLATTTAAAQKPVPPAGFDQQIIYHTVKLAPGELQNVTVTCPPGWTATDGGLERADPGIDQEDLTTILNARQIQVPVNNTTDREGFATVWLSCVRAKAALRLKQVVIGAAVLPGAKEALDAECRRRTKALLGDHYIDLQPGGQRRADVRAAGIVPGSASFLSLRPTARGYRATVDGGSTGGQVRLRVACVDESLTLRGGGERRVTVDRERVTASAPAGDSVLNAGCGRGRIPLGRPGFQTGAGVFAQPALGFDGGGQIRLSNPTGAPAKVTLHLACSRGKLLASRSTGITVDTTAGPPQIGPG